MFRNYFYINRAVTELNNILPGLRIDEIFTQDKNKLYFAIGNKEFPYRHLIISTDQNIPYFQIKNEHYKAKKNSTTFFNNLLPDEIINVEIAENDRIIRINLKSAGIYFTIRGRDTNIIIINSDRNYESFKKILCNEEEIINDLLNSTYSANAVIPDLSEFSFSGLQYPELRKLFSRISKDMFIEAKARTHSDSNEEFKNNLYAVILEVFSENISVFYDEAENKMFFLPASFLKSKENNKAERAENYLNAINKYISLKYKNESSSSIRDEISKYLDKELYKLSGKLNSLRKRIDEGSKEEIYKNFGNLLLTNIHLLDESLFKCENRKDELVLNDYETGNDITVKLNTKIQPKQNIDYYFDKSRDERINYSKSIELFEESEKSYNYLLQIKTEFEKSSTLDELNAVKSKLKIKTDKQPGKKMEDQIKFRHYLIEDKYHVYIGRDSKSNDLLSTKFAKQNDYWFHARGLPGSHVILRVDNSKEVVPKNVIKDVASIAAFFSKAKTAGTAPVAYTFAKFVYKKKGMEPGQVIVQKEKVILVKPGIPANCAVLED